MRINWLIVGIYLLPISLILVLKEQWSFAGKNPQTLAIHPPIVKDFFEGLHLFSGGSTGPQSRAGSSPSAISTTASSS